MSSRLVDEVEVCRELTPLLPLPFLLSYAEDILAGVEAFHLFGLTVAILQLAVHPVQDLACELL